MNLAVSGHSVAPSTIDSTALIYQQNDHQQQQQQPISYKLPQVNCFSSIIWSKIFIYFWNDSLNWLLLQGWNKFDSTTKSQNSTI